MPADSNYYRDLERLSLRRIEGWDLSGVSKKILREIVHLSFGRTRAAVLMQNQHLAELTKTDEGNVSKAIQELRRIGVLSVQIRKGNYRRFEFHPGAKFVTPPVIVEPATRERILQEVEALNAHGDDGEPDGQRLLSITTVEELLEQELAEGSRQRCLEETEPPAHVRASSAPLVHGARVSNASAKNDISGRRRELHEALRARGWSEDDIAATDQVPVAFLPPDIFGAVPVGKIPTNTPELVKEQPGGTLPAEKCASMVGKIPTAEPELVKEQPDSSEETGVPHPPVVKIPTSTHELVKEQPAANTHARIMRAHNARAYACAHAPTTNHWYQW